MQTKIEQTAGSGHNQKHIDKSFNTKVCERGELGVSVSEQTTGSRRFSNVFIATGGTGGHIFPAIAVASELVEQKHHVSISTDARGAEMVQKNKPQNANIVRIWASGVGGKGTLNKITSLFKIACSAAALFFRFLILRPNCILAFGGYSSAPAVLAGRALKIPVYLHEQNAAAGRANAVAAKFANKILTSFPNVSGLPKNAKTEYTGLPVRKDFAPKPYIFDKNEIRILITGGSLGAKILRDVMPTAIAALPETLRKRLLVVEQIDNEHLREIQKFYDANEIKCHLTPFIKDMATEIERAALVIGRSGASTVVEIMTIGRPAIFVPLTINPDQLANANAFASRGAGLVVKQSEFTPKFMTATLTELLENPARLEKMAEKSLTSNTAVQSIITAIIK
jgi:UDP-N-acetylglucosamine--N-acetylmuramyl-(pentapeptide) pyrophosphoryl-undecaprenol N-acetylglucosamine transferase